MLTEAAFWCRYRHYATDGTSRCEHLHPTKAGAMECAALRGWGWIGFDALPDDPAARGGTEPVSVFVKAWAAEGSRG